MADRSSCESSSDEEKSIGFGPVVQGEIVAGLSLRESALGIAIQKTGLVDSEQKESTRTAIAATPSSAAGTDPSTKEVPTPTIGPKHGNKLYRGLRWTYFSVYRRLFTLCFFANVIALIAVGATGNLNYMNSATAASINILVALLVRQEHVVNLLFITATAVPTSYPLWLRRRIAKVYCYGGWHSGCGVAGAVWYMVFAGYATYDYTHSRPDLFPTIIISYINISMLLLIITFAYPAMRMKLHDYFEITHRFAGWTIVGLFWAQIALLATSAPGSTGIALINLPAFWCLSIITVLIAYPWIRLRHRTIYFEYLSAHAVRLHFMHASLDYCIGVRLSRNPLFETHSFATIPNKPGDDKGFSVLISNAGDWTKKTIQSAAPVATLDLEKAEITAPPMVHTSSKSVPETKTSRAGKHASTLSNASVLSWTSTSGLLPKGPNHKRMSSFGRSTIPSQPSIPPHWLKGKIYTRGAPIYGVLRVADLFRNPLIVTTGSGIGPCLSLLAGRPGASTHWTCRILWATKAPLKTYGKSVVDDVKRADAWARVVDTGVEGRPDMLKLSWDMWRESGNGGFPAECGAVGRGAMEKRRSGAWEAERGWKSGAWDAEKGPGPWNGQRSEAVVVISNPKVTRKVVYGLESRGVPAFGVIFDS